MSTASGNFLPVGLRWVQILALVSGGSTVQNGLPAASGSALYEGVHIVGGKAFTVNTPDARVISHVGDDRVLAQDILPPLDSATAELRAARGDFAVLAAIMNTKVLTLGEGKIVGFATDQQGYEPQYALVMYQQAIDTDTGAQNWRGFFIPKARIIPKPQGMSGDNPSEIVYQVLPYTVSKHVWGVAFAAGTEGFIEAAILEVQGEGKPWICGWKGNGAQTAFNFHADRPAKNTSKINVVTVNGVVQVPTTKTTTGITISPAPAADVYIVCYYEI